MTYVYEAPRWWWESLIDWMVANPGASLKEATVGHGGPIDVTYATILNVVGSDLFKARLAQRKSEISAATDEAILSRTTKIAVLGLDAITSVLEKKRDQIPLSDLQEITGSALDRLGYGAQKPGAGPSVNVNVGVQQVNAPSVNPEALRSARELLENKQREQAALPPPVSESIGILENPGEKDALSGAMEGEIVDVEALDVSDR